MTLLRVTVSSASYSSLAGLEAANSRLARLQNQMSSGKQISTPSDDPQGATRALQLRGEAKRNVQYQANSADAIGWLSSADTAYGQLSDLASKARTLVVQGLNTGAQSAGTANAIAQQVDGIRASMISLANSTYQGQPVFGGTTTGSLAYAADGSYLGDSGTTTRLVGPQASVPVTVSGPQVFGSDSSSIFSLLSNISDTLRTNPAGLTGSLSQLDSAISQLSSGQQAGGAAYSSVEAAQLTQTSTGASLTAQLSDIQDIDIAQVAVQMSAANASYQAALQTTASIKQLSLLNFLN